MKRLITLALATLLTLGVIAPAASAVTTGAGTLQGIANVGRHFTNDCTKDAANVTAVGQGLFIPPPVGPDPKDGVWSLHTTVAGVFSHQGEPEVTGVLHACGWLSHVGKISEPVEGQSLGPACGVSKGHNGRGQIIWDQVSGGVNLFDLGWKTSAGGTLPVFGKYQAFNTEDDDDKAKLAKWGNITAEVQAQGGVPCAEAKNCPDQKTAPAPTPGCGAQQFTVAGPFELVHVGDGKEDVVRLNDAPGTCKSGEPTCLYDPKTSSKEPIPGKTT